MDETSEFLHEILHTPSLLERISRTLRTTTMTTAEIDAMKTDLIRDFKKPFTDSIKASGSDDPALPLIIDSFEKRIRTLPDDFIIDLHEKAKKLKTMRTAAGKEFVCSHIFNELALSYSLDGWFRKELIESIRRGSRKIKK